MSPEVASVIVAGIAAVASTITAIVVAVIQHRQKKMRTPVEGTYAAVNSGRMERIESAVFEIKTDVATLAGEVAALKRDTD